MLADLSPFRLIVGHLMLAVLYTVCWNAGMVTEFTERTGLADPGPLRAPDDIENADLGELFPDDGQPSDGARTVLETLNTLPVAGWAPDAGYNRDEFGPRWADVDRNGCDTRNDILTRDLVDETFKDGTNGCVVLTGTLTDPYTGQDIGFVRGESTSSLVQIDHVVPLAAAWRTGAKEWTAEVRTQFANDPVNLLAVDGPTNGSKSDSDAANWLPPNEAFRCEYVALQVQVKADYGLWVTPAEKTAMTDVLGSC